MFPNPFPRIRSRPTRTVERWIPSNLPADPEGFLDAARRAVGESDFGPPVFLEGFRRLHRSLRMEARPHRRGAREMSNLLHHLLCNRLRIEAARKRDPGIREEVVKRPIVILGLPRTGSTFLHRMLSADPDLRALSFQEAFTPAAKDMNTRTAAARRYLDALEELAPDLMARHAITPEAPEECVFLLQNTFCHPFFGVHAHVPGYMRWLREMDLAESYADYKSQLKLLQRGRPRRRWVLKAPSHCSALTELKTVFPDAHWIQTHRHPADVIPSFAGLLRCYRGVFSRRPPRLRTLGPPILRTMVEWQRALATHRETWPRERQTDVLYGDLVGNPLECCRQLYTRLDLPWTPEKEAGFTTRLARERDGRIRQPPPELGDVGLSREAVRRAFGDYLERHELG